VDLNKAKLITDLTSFSKSIATTKELIAD